MTVATVFFLPSLSFDWIQQTVFTGGAIERLFVAGLLGGAVGLEREINRKAAGVRTNLLISMGSAFFTVLSVVLAGDGAIDKSRVASNIVQGVGFLGAGLILHNRNRVSGLTSAASVFVVASIGMAAGAGQLGAALAATIMVIVALRLVGFLERKANLKTYPLIYEARGRDQTLILASILDAMDKAEERLGTADHDAIGDLQRIVFTLTATKKQHELVRMRLLAEPAIESLKTFRDPEED
jgi:putative Mg2+ transporter-C (MgtC) family protein